MALRPILIALFGAALATTTFAVPSTSRAQVAVSVTIAPPPLPVYEQPPLPAVGWIWTPGYWAWGPDGYFWVPGTWVEPPEVGLLWTPGYWAWSDGIFVWYEGYWCPLVGFYGGVNYGFGYFGHGYEGGYWRGTEFFYNSTVNNLTDVHITNVYTKTVVSNVIVNRVSYVGGPGGIVARPTAEEEQAALQRHVPATSMQAQHRESAALRPELLASVNHGKPPIAATARPNDFSTRIAAASHAGGPVHLTQPVHARDLPKPEPISEPPTSATAEERAYLRRLEELQARQEQEREALVQEQESEHAKFAQQPSQNQQAFAAMERQHQLQTAQMLQHHAEQALQIPRPSPIHRAAVH